MRHVSGTGMVEEFEYIDGTEGKLKMKDSSGKAISYDSPYDIFKNKDPRLLGSVYLPGADYKGYGGGKSNGYAVSSTDRMG